ncbi:uncharacterized protein [Lolium perenne]|uniref:uncharacterized protein isoform X2 n=1 Tax=Lolium perenne TaxID=4522 RepID=UPI003A98FF94
MDTIPLDNGTEGEPNHDAEANIHEVFDDTPSQQINTDREILSMDSIVSCDEPLHQEVTDNDGAGDEIPPKEMGHSEDTAPTDWREAIMDPKWKAAMLEEMEALEKNNTWEVVELPKGNDIAGIEELKQQLKREFEVKDLGQLRYFLGIEVSRSSKEGLRCKRGEVEEIKERKAEEKISLCSSVPSLSSSRRNLAYNPL